PNPRECTIWLETTILELATQLFKMRYKGSTNMSARPTKYWTLADTKSFCSTHSLWKATTRMFESLRSKLLIGSKLNAPRCNLNPAFCSRTCPCGDHQTQIAARSAKHRMRCSAAQDTSSATSCSKTLPSYCSTRFSLMPCLAEMIMTRAPSHTLFQAQIRWLQSTRLARLAGQVACLLPVTRCSLYTRTPRATH
ncbi:hypothetical protein GGF47_001908, partial [Coemansia sp. RSA 2524]